MKPFCFVLGCEKLGIGSPHKMRLFLQDGFEIDSDDVLCSDLTKSAVLILSMTGDFTSNGKSVYIYYKAATCSMHSSPNSGYLHA